MKEFFKNLLNKFTSRKFLVCAAIVGVGICMTMGVSSSELTEIIGMISTLLGGMTYIVAEARVDSDREKSASKNNSKEN